MLFSGIGLAGALWAELEHSNLALRRRSGRERMTLFNETMVPGVIIPKRVIWRVVEPIANDPDQPYNLRLQLAVQAGVGLAAGVKYHFRDTRGLVVYMARGGCFIANLWKLFHLCLW